MGGLSVDAITTGVFTLIGVISGGIISSLVAIHVYTSESIIREY